jgi:acyl-[acyl-carrier-protein] desaturase|tara:strand:- start:160 stop:459 length:300 start_codon:yes stop_codon:yes gene_type:complete
MPAELMSEPSNPNLYNDFSRIATDLNVYTGVDYAEIMEHLNEFWKIGEVTGLTPEAEEAQEYLMKLPTRFNKLAQRQAKSLAKKPREPKEWAWINGRVI